MLELLHVFSDCSVDILSPRNIVLKSCTMCCTVTVSTEVAPAAICYSVSVQGSYLTRTNIVKMIGRCGELKG